MKTHYEVLGVPFGADYETIRAAYRNALKAYHPDLHEGNTTAELISKRIIDAHSVLKDPEKRALYDEQLLYQKAQRRRLFLITMLLTGGLVFGSSVFALQMSLGTDGTAVSFLDELLSSDRSDDAPADVAERVTHEATSIHPESAPAEIRPASPEARNVAEQRLVTPSSGPVDLPRLGNVGAPAAPAAPAPSTPEAAPAALPKQEPAQLPTPPEQRDIKNASLPVRERQDPAGVGVQPERAPVTDTQSPFKVANAPSSPLIAPPPISSPKPVGEIEASLLADGPAQLGRGEEAWDDIRQRGNVAEIVRFVYDYWGTPQGELAEQWLQDLVETTEDVSRLEALRAEATGSLALKAQFRIERLAAQKEMITAALSEKVEEAEPPSPPQPSPPAAAMAVTPEPGPVPTEAPDPAAGITPRDPKQHIKKGLSLLKAGQHDQAISSFDKAILLEPGNAKSYLQRASAWEAKGELDKALADYDAAINLDQTSIPALNARGMLWHRRGEFEKALTDLDRAIRLSFSDAKVYRDRGTVWYDMGRYNRAIADFNRAITINPNLASAYVSRGKAFQTKGDPLTATINFEKAVQRDPSIGKARDLMQARSDVDLPTRKSPGISR